MSELIKYNRCGNLRVRKYTKDVFYDNLWNEDPILLESRGHVLDDNDRLVARPFKKVFNYKENDTTCDLDKIVCVVDKINGFMFHVTYDIEHGFINGTTGSLSSSFVELGLANFNRWSVNRIPMMDIMKGFDDRAITYIFEIKDNANDPHIIDDESDGVYLLGARFVDTGELLSQSVLDSIAKQLNAKRPNWKVTTFEKALEEVQSVQHEGFMIYDVDTLEAILKLKSPYYISKKFLMRRHPTAIYNDDYKTQYDEEYYPIITKVRELYTLDKWTIMSEQEKGHVFNVIHNADLLSKQNMMFFIMNHPKLSYRLKKDYINIHYSELTGNFEMSVDLYGIDNETMELVKKETIKHSNYFHSIAMKNLYLEIAIRFGFYDYDENTEKNAKISYYKEIKRLAELKIAQAYTDIEYYKALED